MVLSLGSLRSLKANFLPKCGSGDICGLAGIILLKGLFTQYISTALFAIADVSVSLFFPSLLNFPVQLTTFIVPS